MLFTHFFSCLFFVWEEDAGPRRKRRRQKSSKSRNTRIKMAAMINKIPMPIMAYNKIPMRFIEFSFKCTISFNKIKFPEMIPEHHAPLSCRS